MTDDKSVLTLSVDSDKAEKANSLLAHLVRTMGVDDLEDALTVMFMSLVGLSRGNGINNIDQNKMLAFMNDVWERETRKASPSGHES